MKKLFCVLLLSLGGLCLVGCDKDDDRDDKVQLEIDSTSDLHIREFTMQVNEKGVTAYRFTYRVDRGASYDEVTYEKSKNGVLARFVDNTATIALNLSTPSDPAAQVMPQQFKDGTITHIIDPQAQQTQIYSGSLDAEVVVGCSIK